MSLDTQISVAGTTALPVSYTVPNTVEVMLLCVNATIDGTGAAGAFLATVEIVSDGGIVVARCPCFTVIAAGGTAEISWFRINNSFAATSALTPYQTVILQLPDVRSYWPLDETSGTVFADLGPSNVPLTMIGPPTIGTSPLITTGRSATFSGAVDGSGVAVQWAHSSSGYGVWPNGGSFSVMGWLDTLFVPTAPAELLCEDNNSERFLQFRLTTTGKVELVTFFALTSVNPSVVGATSVNDGAKHFLVGTFDANTLAQKVYVDGVLDGNVAATGSQSVNVTGMQLAARLTLDARNQLGGVMDEYALVSRAITQAEITSIYNAGRGV